MACKLIAFDLDGTLLDEDKSVPTENLRALEAAAERGIALVPATGRILEGVPEPVRCLPFLRYYICVNGAYVVDTQTEEVLYRGEIPVDLALRALDYIHTLPVLYDCYQNNHGWMTRRMYENAEPYFVTEPEILKLIRRTRTPVEDLRQTLRERGEPVQKLQMHFRPDQMELRRCQTEQIPRLFPELTAASSLSNNIELNSVKAGKGRALLALSERLGIDREDTVAFGDGSNDIDLLRAAGWGVAMANATEDVKAAADAVTGSNREAGVAQTIWELLEEK